MSVLSCLNKISIIKIVLLLEISILLYKVSTIYKLISVFFKSEILNNFFSIFQECFVK